MKKLIISMFLNVVIDYLIIIVQKKLEQATDIYYIDRWTIILEFLRDIRVNGLP